MELVMLLGRISFEDYWARTARRKGLSLVLRMPNLTSEIKECSAEELPVFGRYEVCDKDGERRLIYAAGFDRYRGAIACTSESHENKHGMASVWANQIFPLHIYTIKKCRKLRV